VIKAAVFLSTIVAGAALCCAAPVAAKVKDKAITATSPESLVIMHSGSASTGYDLRFSQEGQGGFGRKIYSLEKKYADRSPYTTRAFKPGTYVLNSIVQQGAWSTCFTRGTFAFTIQPGRIYYIGEVNSAPLLIDLQRSAIARGRTRLSSGALAIGWEPEVQPSFSPVTSADLADVQRFVASTMPRSTAPVEALAGRPANFTATKGERAIQVCG
jgi:hypothetical protein